MPPSPSDIEMIPEISGHISVMIPYPTYRRILAYTVTFYESS